TTSDPMSGLVSIALLSTISSFFLQVSGVHRDLLSFPTRTLFRSQVQHYFVSLVIYAIQPIRALQCQRRTASRTSGSIPQSVYFRSEEHTSELQSRFDLVCRLLLEKKKHDTLIFCSLPRFCQTTQT